MDAVASRYALAISKLASEQGQLLTYLNLFKDLKALTAKDATLLDFLSNEFYSPADKQTLLDKAFPSETWLWLSAMLKVMLVYRRIALLPLVIEQTMVMLQDLLNKQEGIIYSAFSLTTNQVQQLQTVMSEHLNLPITLTVVVEPSILGGFRIDIGDKVFDASVINQLANLKKMLLKRGMAS
jgi:F-type H+-transporting ATPase subunit delta